MSNSHWKCEVNSPSQTIQLSSLWLAGGKHYKGVKRKQNCSAPILLSYKLVDILLKKLKSHHKLINNLIWLSLNDVSEKVENMITLPFSENPMSFIETGKMNSVMRYYMWNEGN